MKPEKYTAKRTQSKTYSSKLNKRTLPCNNSEEKINIDKDKFYYNHAILGGCLKSGQSYVKKMWRERQKLKMIVEKLNSLIETPKVQIIFKDGSIRTLQEEEVISLTIECNDRKHAEDRIITHILEVETKYEKQKPETDKISYFAEENNLTITKKGYNELIPNIEKAREYIKERKENELINKITIKENKLKERIKNKTKINPTEIPRTLQPHKNNK